MFPLNPIQKNPFDILFISANEFIKNYVKKFIFTFICKKVFEILKLPVLSLNRIEADKKNIATFFLSKIQRWDISSTRQAESQNFLDLF